MASSSLPSLIPPISKRGFGSRPSLSPGHQRTQLSPISKRGLGGRPSLSPGHQRAHALLGRRIAVPYRLVIEDDYSGCLADAIVLVVSQRGCLVKLGGEDQWHPESFIRQWMVAEDMLVWAFGGFNTTDAGLLDGSSFSGSISMGSDSPPHSC